MNGPMIDVSPQRGYGQYTTQRPQQLTFDHIRNNEKIYLYLGHRPLSKSQVENIPFVGICLEFGNQNHIHHDITKPFALNDNSVDVIQSEDVMEHIELDFVVEHLNEMHRLLKPNGLFRLSMPDYRTDILKQRTHKDENGKLIFDPSGGGSWDEVNKKVIGGGHVWFPIYELVYELFEKSNFEMNRVNWLHYYETDEQFTLNDIDYSLGHIHRTPDHDARVQNPRRPMSMVIDAFK